jgi:exopolysaccharide biosynthesis polyprenyl glycosylphosphotransferase
MHTARIKLKQLLLLAGDYAIFELALILTLFLRYGTLAIDVWEAHLVPFSIVSFLWLVSFYIVGLYELSLTRDSFRFFRTYLEGMIVNLAIAIGFFYLVPIFGIAPRTNLLLYFACALLLGYAWRLLFNRTIAPALFRNQVLFIGHANDASRIHDLLQSSGAGFELVAVAETAPGTRFDTGEITWHVDLAGVDQIIRERSVHTIVLGHRPDDVPGLRDALYKTLFTPVALIDRASLEEAVTGRVPLEYVSQTWFLENLREHEKAWYESAKRFFDLVLAIPFGIVTLILFPFVALAIKLSSPGPVLYSQVRVGKYGKPFRIWKFRTMHVDAEKHGPQFTADAKTDPRLFTVGRILRQLRVDELPQIWNVFKGDLSLIGPRPERPEFVDPLTVRMPFYTLRHLTRPGLTGWAQVRFLTPNATIEDNLTKLQYDLYYIKHRSLLLDLAILLKTVGIVIKRQGT